MLAFRSTSCSPFILTCSGQSSLPQACPVCLHEPVKADDCRPNKALRTTIKVFLRKKGIEREAALKKESLDKAVGPPVEPSPSQDLETSVSGNGEPNGVVPQASSGILNKIEPNSSPSAHAPQASQVEDQKDIPRPSVEVCDFFIRSRRLLMAFSLSMMGVIEMVLTISRWMRMERRNRKLQVRQTWTEANTMESLLIETGYGERI